MALRVRFVDQTGQSLAYAIERLADGLKYDFGDGTFKATPATGLADLTEGTGDDAGLYRITLDPTPSDRFTDGQYSVTIHDKGATNLAIEAMPVVMRGGDDAPVFPEAGGSGIDPWSVALPGSYGAGTAGSIVAQIVALANLLGPVKAATDKIPANPAVAGGPMTLDLTQGVPARDVSDKTAMNVGDCLAAGFAGAAGGRTLDRAGRTLTIANADGSPLVVLHLDNADTPTLGTPRG